MEEKLISGIYKITNPKGRVYIGQAEDLISREIDYQRVYPVKNQIRVYNSIMKYGWKAHTFEVWERCPIKDLNRIERYWQEYFDVLSPMGMNCKYTPTDEKRQVISEKTKQKISNTLKGRMPSQKVLDNLKTLNVGRICTEETREKIRAANTGRKQNPEAVQKMITSLTGRKLSEDHKEKIRKANLGKKRSEESKEKMSKAQKGHYVSLEVREKMSIAKKNMSEDTKLKMSNSKKGKPSPRKGVVLSEEVREKMSLVKKLKGLSEEHKKSIIETNSKKVLQFDLEDNFIKEWSSMTEASKSLKISKSNISSCCANQRKTAGKFKWKYKQ